MKLYELIIALHPSLSTEDTQDLVAKVKALFPAGIKIKMKSAIKQFIMLND